MGINAYHGYSLAGWLKDAARLAWLARWLAGCWLLTGRLASRLLAGHLAGWLAAGCLAGCAGWLLGDSFGPCSAHLFSWFPWRLKLEKKFVSVGVHSANSAFSETI